MKSLLIALISQFLFVSLLVSENQLNLMQFVHVSMSFIVSLISTKTDFDVSIKTRWDLELIGGSRSSDVE